MRSRAGAPVGERVTGCSRRALGLAKSGLVRGRGGLASGQGPQTLLKIVRQ